MFGRNWLLRKAVGAVFQEQTTGDGSTTATATLTQPPNDASKTTTTAGDGSTTTTPPATAAWYDSFKDAETKEWLKAYNNAYPDPEAVAMKARNLEKFIGAEKAGRGVIVPKPDAKPEEWRAFYAKVGGVPEKAEGYALPTTLDAKVKAELEKDPVFAAFQKHAHEVGMPQQFFQNSIQWFAKQMADAENGKLDQFEKTTAAEHEALKTEWGKDYDQNIEQARRAVKAFIPHEDAKELESVVSRIEGALGTAATFKLFQNIGKSLGEDAFVAGGGTGGMGGMTVEGAKLRISQLRQDPAWVSRWSNGGADERAEFDRLTKIVADGAQKQGT
jgi:hypothetical protein